MAVWWSVVTTIWLMWSICANLSAALCDMTFFIPESRLRCMYIDTKKYSGDWGDPQSPVTLMYDLLIAFTCDCGCSSAMNFEVWSFWHFWSKCMTLFLHKQLAVLTSELVCSYIWYKRKKFFNEFWAFCVVFTFIFDLHLDMCISEMTLSVTLTFDLWPVMMCPGEVKQKNFDTRLSVLHFTSNY